MQRSRLTVFALRPRSDLEAGQGGLSSHLLSHAARPVSRGTDEACRSLPGTCKTCKGEMDVLICVRFTSLPACQPVRCAGRLGRVRQGGRPQPWTRLSRSSSVGLQPTTLCLFAAGYAALESIPAHTRRQVLCFVLSCDRWGRGTPARCNRIFSRALVCSSLGTNKKFHKNRLLALDAAKASLEHRLVGLHSRTRS